MIHFFKQNGVRAAIDSRDGSISILDNLSYLMLPEMPAHPTPEMPTSLRYALAKFDSRDLAAAYHALYTLTTAEKEPYVPSAVTSATVTITAAPLPTLPDSVKTVCLTGHDSAALTAAYVEVENRIVKAPWAVMRAISPDAFRMRIVAAAPTDPDFHEILPFLTTEQNTAVEFAFSGEDNLCEMVMELLRQGVSAVSAYPGEGVTEEAAIEQYDKLSRELVRYRKKGGSGVFAPFAFDFYKVGEKGSHIQYGADGTSSLSDEAYMGQFTEAYVRSGLLAHLTDLGFSPALVAKCVECAVSLQ